MHKQGMLKENALKGKTVIITGGGTGIGRAMTRYFMELGAKLVITSRKMEVLEKTAEELRNETEGEVLPLQCDVRDYEQVDNVISQTIKHYGSFNALVNNAAGNFISPTERLSHRAFDAVVDIVLKGSYNCTLAAGKYWVKEKITGTVLSTLTTYAFTGSGYVAPSACGKAGVLALTRSLAVEWGKYGIRLNAIAPGPFPTKGAWEQLLPEPMRDKFDPAKKVPVGRVGDLQEVANLAAYLVSDYSAYINGDIISIDGGEWLKGAGQFNNLEMITTEMWDMLEQFTRGKKS
ncbi:MAG: short-chain dehydrogenase [Flavobacteriales bacterium]|nr:MAG: short-chain dehydrogenase [Flavobacteriales bacterium]